MVRLNLTNNHDDGDNGGGQGPSKRHKPGQGPSQAGGGSSSPQQNSSLEGGGGRSNQGGRAHSYKAPTMQRLLPQTKVTTGITPSLRGVTSPGITSH